MSKQVNTTDLCREILTAAGGRGNIATVAHCATRLRLTINDTEKIDTETIKSIPGVLGLVIKQNEYQIIIGTTVPSVYAEFINQGDFKDGGYVEDAQAKAEDVKNVKKEHVKEGNAFVRAIQTIGDFIAACVLPALPVIVAGGMINAILSICVNFFNLSDQSGTYIVLKSVYNAAFNFLPIYVGYNAANKKQIPPMLGALLGGVLVCSEINGASGLTFLSIPVTSCYYSSTIIPVILGVLFLAVIYKPVSKAIPKEIAFFVVPLISMIVAVPVTLVALGPIATWVSSVLSTALVWMNVHFGWLSLGMIGFLTVLMVYTGTGAGLYAVELIAFAENGCEQFAQPGMLAGNVAVGGAAIAIMLLCKKDDEMRPVALSTGLTAVFGITEPAVFGVLAQKKCAFIGAMIGGAIAGLFAGYVHLTEYTFLSPGVASIIAFMNPDGSMSNLIYALITIVLAFVCGLVATMILGKRESKNV